MDPDRSRQTLMRQRAEQMCEAARAAAVQASALSTATAVTRLAAQRMRSDNQRMLAAARTGPQKSPDAAPALNSY
ncbi:hypothetical protein [Streptomyces sp. NPDC047043]|uniref:hypothetical protein n=1 Tax=Streptomyces sp. NPDC047043 TaxID=3154497 RepID=UPI0033CFB8B3